MSKFPSRSIESNEGWKGKHTANVFGGSSDLEVTVISPACTPLVLDKEVFNSGIWISIESDGHNTVIK